MKQKIVYISFSILLLFVFTTISFAKQIEKDNSVKKQTDKIEQKNQAVQKTDTNSKENTTKSETQTKTTPSGDKTQVLKEFPPMTTSTSAGEQINWEVISSGGVRGTSTNYILSSTVGQTAVGFGTSTNFQLNAGFWQNFVSEGCCIGLRGNIDGGFDDGTLINSVDISDLVYLVDFMFRGGLEPTCFDEANVTGNTDSIDISELVYLVDYMFRGGADPVPC